MPLVDERRRVVLEESADEVRVVDAVAAGRLAGRRIIRPGVRVLVIVDVVTEFVQRQNVVEVVPRHSP